MEISITSTGRSPRSPPRRSTWRGWGGFFEASGQSLACKTLFDAKGEQPPSAGEGIAEENLQRLFDPFFSTRPDGHGIGLAVVQQLVNLHGAEISVSSTLGDGTTFRLWWPTEVPD